MHLQFWDKGGQMVQRDQTSTRTMGMFSECWRNVWWLHQACTEHCPTGVVKVGQCCMYVGVQWNTQSIWSGLKVTSFGEKFLFLPVSPTANTWNNTWDLLDTILDKLVWFIEIQRFLATLYLDLKWSCKYNECFPWRKWFSAVVGQFTWSLQVLRTFFFTANPSFSVSGNEEMVTDSWPVHREICCPSINNQSFSQRLVFMPIIYSLCHQYSLLVWVW